MRTPPGDDELLVAAARDAEVFGAFYRRHAPAVLGYLRYRTGDIESAADLTADVFAAAFAARRRFKPGREPARAWLFGIANNLLAMRGRKQRRAAAASARLNLERIEFDDQALERADADLSAWIAGNPATALVQDLPPDQRAAVLARIVDERDYDDIAGQLGCSEATVRQRVSRGLSRVGRKLGKEGT